LAHWSRLVLSDAKTGTQSDDALQFYGLSKHEDVLQFGKFNSVFC